MSSADHGPQILSMDRRGPIYYRNHEFFYSTPIFQVLECRQVVTAKIEQASEQSG